jgi:hypothetical protein
MRKTLYAGILILIGAMAHSAMQPMPTEAQQATPVRGAVQAPQTKPIADADTAVIAPLLAKKEQVEQQIRSLMTQLRGPDGQSGILKDLQIAEQDAYSHAKLDMRFWKISDDGKSFELRQSPQPNH